MGVINISARGASGLDSRFPGYPLEVLIHETRHIESGMHPCRGLYDNTVAEMGAFGVQYLMLVWWGMHSDRPLDEKKYALFRAAQLGTGAFCEECPQPPSMMPSARHAVAPPFWTR